MDSIIHRIIDTLTMVIVFGSVIAAPNPAISTDRVLTIHAAIGTITRCFAEKGERVSPDAVRQWVIEFRDKYGESEASSWVIAERIACRHRYRNTAYGQSSAFQYISNQPLIALTN